MHTFQVRVTRMLDTTATVSVESYVDQDDALSIKVLAMGAKKAVIDAIKAGKPIGTTVIRDYSDDAFKLHTQAWVDEDPEIHADLVIHRDPEPEPTPTNYMDTLESNMKSWDELEQSLKEIVMIDLTVFAEKYTELIADTDKCPVAVPTLVERYTSMKRASHFAILKLNGNDPHSWDAVDPIRKEFIYGALLSKLAAIVESSKDYTMTGLVLAGDRMHDLALAYHRAADFLGYWSMWIPPSKASWNKPRSASGR